METGFSGIERLAKTIVEIGIICEIYFIVSLFAKLGLVTWDVIYI